MIKIHESLSVYKYYQKLLRQLYSCHHFICGSDYSDSIFHRTDTHSNGIKMVEMMLELSEFKIGCFSAKYVTTEEAQKFYKRLGYHSLLSTVPLFI